MSATLGDRLTAIPVRGVGAHDSARLRDLIAARAQDPDDEALLLDALGLLDPGRRLRSSPGDRLGAGSKVVHGAGPGALERHEELGEEPCAACQRWAAVQARKRGQTPEELEPPADAEPGTACGGAAGSIRGYRRHLKAHDTPCQPCRDANADKSRERYTPTPLALAPCGSKSAKRRHRRRGEQCEHCWPVGAVEVAA